MLLIFWENKERYIQDTNYEEVDHIGDILAGLTGFVVFMINHRNNLIDGEPGLCFDKLVS